MSAPRSLAARLGAAALAAALTLPGCRKDPLAEVAASASAHLAAAPVVPAGPLGSGAPPAPAAIDDELSTQPMELMRFAFTSAIERREPKDELTHAKPGQRVHAFLAIRNRTGRKRSIHLAWTVNGEERTKLDLDVDESWQFRTWGFNTVLPRDRGTLRLEVTDDAGNSLVERELPIRP